MTLKVGLTRQQYRLFQALQQEQPPDDIRRILAYGTIRSGKSWSGTLGWMRHTQEVPEGDHTHIISGFSYRQISNVLVGSYMRKFAQDTGLEFDFKSTKGELRVGNQNYLVLAGQHNQSYGKLLGINGGSLLLDEAVLMPDFFVETAISRCSEDWSRALLMTNPDHPTCWVKRQLDEGFFHDSFFFSFKDNPKLAARIIKSYYSQYSGVLRERFIEGKWSSAEGLLWPFYRTVPLDKRKLTGHVLLCADYGPGGTTAILALLEQDDRSWIVGETTFLTVDGRTRTKAFSDSELTAAAKEMAARWNAPSIVVDPTATSWIQDLQDNGLIAIKGNNAVVEGLGNVRTGFTTGDLLIAETGNEKLTDEIAAYVGNPKDPSRPLKKKDHGCDALRYGWQYIKEMGLLRPEEEAPPQHNALTRLRRR